MAENRHITRINDTQANGRANLDPHQIMIETDGDHLLTWKDETTPTARYYTGAAQHYWDGASLTYLDVTFDDVTARGDMYLGNGASDTSLYHGGDTDTRIRIRDDRISIYAGNVALLDIVEGGTDYVAIDPAGTGAKFSVSTSNPQDDIDFDTNTIYQYQDVSAVHTLTDSYAYGDIAGPYLQRQYNFAEGTRASPVNLVDNGAVLYRENFRIRDDAGNLTDAGYYDVIATTTGASANRVYWTWSGQDTTGGGGGFTELMRIAHTDGVIVNWQGTNAVPFTVESLNNAYMFHVDVADDRIGINRGSPATQLHGYWNSSSTTPQWLIENDGTGDAALEFLLTGARAVTMGIDNSASGDLFKICTTSSLMTNEFTMNNDGHIGINATPDANYKFDVYWQPTNDHASYGLNCLFEGKTTVQGNYQQGAFRVRADTTGSSARNTGYLRGVNMVAVHNTNTTLDELQAFRVSYGNLTGAGTLTLSRGIDIQLYNQAGTQTDAYDIYCRAPTGGGGSVTNEWCIYSAHAADSRLIDDLFIEDDAKYIKWGAGRDSGIQDSGSDMIIDYDLNGVGGTRNLLIRGNAVVYGTWDTNGLVPSNNATIHAIAQNGAPTSTTEGALWLDMDAGGNGHLMCYANGGWRTVATL
jgi:hypothetical protein